MNKVLLMAMMVFFTLPSQAQVIEQMEIPDANILSDFEPLFANENPKLQADLQARISKNPKFKSLVAANKLGLAIVDLRNLQDIKFAHLNGNEMMYAASLPKIAILLTAMHALDHNELAETKEVTRDLRLMISKSDNQASTRMIDRLGYQKIADVLTDPQYKLYDEANGGGLWVGKRYAAAGARNPDPLEGLSHAATANQICRFYYLMLGGKLVSEERSQEMMNYMVDPALHHKFVNTLDKVAPKARFFRKSGSWSTFHSDSVLVWGPKRKYILAALVNDANGEKIMRDLVYTIEKVLNIDNL